MALNFEKISMVFNEADKKIAEGINISNAFLSSKKVTELSFEIKIFLDSMSTDYLNEFISKDSVMLNCKVMGTTGLFNIKITEKLKFSLATEELIEPIKNDFKKNTKLSLKDIKILSADLSKIKLKAPLIIDNPYPFDLKITGIELKLFSDDQYKTKVAEVSDKSEILLPPGKQTLIEKEIEINTVQGGISGLFKVLQREFDYYINGNLTALFGTHKLIVPLKEKIVVDPVNGTIR
jgi:hypothetical protein